LSTRTSPQAHDELFAHDVARGARRRSRNGDGLSRLSLKSRGFLVVNIATSSFSPNTIKADLHLLMI
jgi:hypothetical protein